MFLILLCCILSVLQVSADDNSLTQSFDYNSSFHSTKVYDSSWYGSTAHPNPAFRAVTDFGARGDGITDDTVSIQAAIDYNRGSIKAKSFAIVYFPPGIYLVSDTIVVYTGTELRGNSITPPTIRLAPNTPKFSNISSLQPLIATTGGYDQTTNYSSKHWWDNSLPSNCIFYVHIHKLNIDLTLGNIGATALYWCVAQQTSLRDMQILVNDAKYGIDICVSTGYEHQGGGGNGGGGSIEDVRIIGGESAIRADSSQWTFRSLNLSNQVSSAIILQDMIWSFAFVDVKISNVPSVLTSLSGLDAVSSTVQFIDVTLTNITSSIAFNMTNAGHPLFLQNIQFIGQIPEKIVANNSGQYEPWPVTLVNGHIDRWAGWPAPDFSKNGIIIQSNQVWLGSMNLPGAPKQPLVSIPRPYFDTLQIPPCNAITDCGATGLNKTDDTVFLQNCINKCDAVFLPAGIYRINDTLMLRASTILVGEILSNIYLNSYSNGFSNVMIEKPVIDTPNDADAMIMITDLSILAGFGNPGATLLRWRAGENSGMWDVNFNISAGASILYGIHATGFGGGVLSNIWIWGADHSFWSMNGLTLDHAIIGFLGESVGPLITYGLACEHHLEAMIALRGASNYDLITFQSEEANPIINASNTTHIEITANSENITFYGTLSCNWWQPPVNHLAIVSNVSTNVNIIGLRSRGSPNAAVLQPEPQGYGPSRLTQTDGWWAILVDLEIPTGIARNISSSSSL
jgi:glucan 1,3-beta-glucosidase